MKDRIRSDVEEAVRRKAAEGWHAVPEVALEFTADVRRPN